VVSKTQSVERISEVYQQGQRIFGENKVQELCQKQAMLPADIEWHFIGHLQTNKVKYIASFVSLIHAVDSLKLLQEIQKQAQKHQRTIDCLLQFHIAQEQSKYGLDYESAIKMLQNLKVADFPNIRIRGVMGMASLTDSRMQIEDEFASLHTIFEQLKTHFFMQHDFFNTLSMGMSGDFEQAITQGSTMVRIGSSIFQE